MFVCLVHDDSGSMYEATCAEYMFGPYPTEDIAKAEAQKFYDAIDLSYVEFWVTIHEIPDVAVPVEDVISELLSKWDDGE